MAVLPALGRPQVLPWDDAVRAWCWSSQPPELIVYKLTIIISYVGTKWMSLLPPEKILPFAVSAGSPYW